MSTIYRHRIEAGALVFNDPLAKPAAAQAWGVDILDGWKTSPAIEVNSTSLGALRDGEDYGDYFPMRSRFVTIGGYAVAATPADAEALHDMLVRDGFPRNADLVLARYESVPKFVRFRRTAALQAAIASGDVDTAALAAALLPGLSSSVGSQVTASLQPLIEAGALTPAEVTAAVQSGVRNVLGSLDN